MPLTGAGERPPRRVPRDELLLVLGLSLGASAVSALISFTGVLTRPGGLGDHAANLNSSRAPDRPWLDLAWQLFGITTALVPVLLVAYLLTWGRGLTWGGGLPAGHGPAGDGALRPGPGLRALGFDATRPRFDLAWGAVVAAGIGGTGLLLYLGAHAAGANLTVVPESLPDVWWKMPVLILAAIQNAVVEEVIVLGFLVLRLGQLGWSPTAVLVGSSVLRGTYHLYQGVGGFFGNVAMGVIFVWLYRRWGRVMPLVVAHALIDIVAFVGYALLAGRVDWLPTA
ncbi:CPBP family intramembrane glutamic endopeptidase [Streptomyces mayteni]